MTEWREVTLGEVCELKRGYDLPRADRLEGTVPIVSSSGVSGFHSEAKVRAPGVVTGRYGTLGQVFFVAEDFWPLNTALYVRDFKGNDPRFVAALLESMNLSQHDGAAAVPGLNRNQLHGLPVRIPEVKAQSSIARILSTFSDLIVNNRRRVAILEKMGRVVYREWFVHFRYPGHEGAVLVDSPVGPIPGGWKVEKLLDVAEVGFGFPFKAKRFSEVGPFPVIRIRDVPRGTTKTFSDEAAPERYRVEDGDVLVGMDGEFYLRQWTGGEAWLNQRVARLRPRNGMAALHLMLAVTDPIKEWNAAITGTTVAHLGKSHLEQVRVIVPDRHLLENAARLFDDFSSQACSLIQAGRSPETIRDLVLPRLVAGQVDVSSLEFRALMDGALA